MTLTRREIAAFLPILLIATAGAAEDALKNGSAMQSTIFNFHDLHPEDNEHGDIFIPVYQGTIQNGIPINLHETSLAPGSVAHAADRHSGTEIFLVREGSLEVEINGKRSQVTAGSIACIAPHDEHALRNTTNQWTRYFVVLIGYTG